MSNDNANESAQPTDNIQAAERSQNGTASSASEALRSYQGPRIQTRGADSLRGLLANVSAATGFVQP